jgi:DNA-binding LacI/PurR family transcriptional regulator
MKNKRQPTIYDVSAETGFSVATISRVLNNPEKVKSETRIRVMETIDKLGFVPKAEARARTLKRFQRIGAITPFFTSPCFVERLRGVAYVVGRTNYELIIYPIDSKLRLEAYLASISLTGNLDGLVMLSVPFTENEAKRLLKNDVKIIAVEYDQDSVSSIRIDNVGGGKLAAKYLLNKGHRQFGFIGEINPPDYAIRPARDRLIGFKEVLAEQNIFLPDENIRSSTIDPGSSITAAKELLTLKDRPTAIFAAADVQAMAVIKAAREMELRVPQDLAVLGFDDIEAANYVGLTTIKQSLIETGRIAAEMLLAQISNGNRTVHHVSIPLEIVERETV